MADVDWEFLSFLVNLFIIAEVLVGIWWVSAAGAYDKPSGAWCVCVCFGPRLKKFERQVTGTSVSHSPNCLRGCGRGHAQFLPIPMGCFLC